VLTEGAMGEVGNEPDHAAAGRIVILHARLHRIGGCGHRVGAYPLPGLRAGGERLGLQPIAVAGKTGRGLRLRRCCRSCKVAQLQNGLGFGGLRAGLVGWRGEVRELQDGARFGRWRLLRGRCEIRQGQLGCGLLLFVFEVRHGVLIGRGVRRERKLLPDAGLVIERAVFLDAAYLVLLAALFENRQTVRTVDHRERHVRLA
jgi:hypothetical protein